MCIFPPGKQSNKIEVNGKKILILLKFGLFSWWTSRFVNLSVLQKIQHIFQIYIILIVFCIVVVKKAPAAGDDDDDESDLFQNPNRVEAAVEVAHNVDEAIAILR